MTPQHTPQERSWLWSPGGLVLLAFLAIAAFFLMTEHRAHVLGALPYVLFLLCPLLHLLMHGQHGSGHTGHGAGQDRPPPRLRHPQYTGFSVILFGFLLQWPTPLTLLMFPILVTMYVRLARWEEREVQAEFGEIYARYAAATPAFFPRLGRAARHA
jgi:protein-S-isoprenylcysteine O-methyltransferase Ste14